MGDRGMSGAATWLGLGKKTGKKPAGVRGDKVQLVNAKRLGRSERMANQNPPKPRKNKRISKRRRKELANELA